MSGLTDYYTILREAIKLTPNADWKTNRRLYYIKGMQAKTPSTCPFCAKQLIVEHEQVYCPQCGLVCQDSTQYSAGVKHCLPYGIRLG